MYEMRAIYFNSKPLHGPISNFTGDLKALCGMDMHNTTSRDFPTNYVTTWYYKARYQPVLPAESTNLTGSPTWQDQIYANDKGMLLANVTIYEDNIIRVRWWYNVS